MLENKNILIFGGDAVLIDAMLPVLLKSKGHFTWMNTDKTMNQRSKVDNINTISLNSIFSVNSYEHFIQEIKGELQSFDGVIFALSNGALRPLKMTKPEHLSVGFEVNCLAFVELVRVLYKNKLLIEGASLLAYSSVSSLMGLKTKMAYAVSKAALNSAILNLASELSLKKIRVNGILKGAMTTDISHDHVKNMFQIGSDTAGNQDLGMTTPDELANLTIFLLSEQVKTMTGTLIKLDGGYSLG
jgi:NAD(P)-dependent dehydrogenase (short-subunit alcohol dehydrogenase family)